MIILFAYPLFLKYDGVSIQKGPVHIVGMSLFLETKNLGTLQTLGNILAPMKIFFWGVHGDDFSIPTYIQAL